MPIKITCLEPKLKSICPADGEPGDVLVQNPGTDRQRFFLVTDSVYSPCGGSRMVQLDEPDVGICDEPKYGPTAVYRIKEIILEPVLKEA